MQLPSQASSIVEGCCVPTTTKATTTDEKVELRTQKARVDLEGFAHCSFGRC